MEGGGLDSLASSPSSIGYPGHISRNLEIQPHLQKKMRLSVTEDLSSFSRDAASPAGDVGACPNCRIGDTALDLGTI